MHGSQSTLRVDFVLFETGVPGVFQIEGTINILYQLHWKA